LITQLQAATWLRFVVWAVLGLIVYGLYGYRHSKLGHGVVVHTDDA
jgi:APA family basic amino acid/polyamine antiporter